MCARDVAGVCVVMHKSGMLKLKKKRKKKRKKLQSKRKKPKERPKHPNKKRLESLSPSVQYPIG